MPRRVVKLMSQTAGSFAAEAFASRQWVALGGTSQSSPDTGMPLNRYINRFKAIFSRWVIPTHHLSRNSGSDAFP